MTRAELIAILRTHRYAVQASLHPAGGSQAALVGIAVGDELELVFDTVTSSRKYRNLIADPRIALVVGLGGESTTQIEGVADIPTGDELERVRATYFAAFPDGRERLAWPGIVHVRVRPTWIRHSDFAAAPPRIVELTAPF